MTSSVDLGWNQVHRLWLVVCVVAVVVLVGQYHASNTWQGLGHVVVDGNGDSLAEASQCVNRGDIYDAIRIALHRMAEDKSFDSAMEKKILGEVAARFRLPWPTPSSTLVPTPTPTSWGPSTAAPCAPPEECLLPALKPRGSLDALPVIYVVTPTYRRPEQLAELTRLGQTLLLVRNVQWLIVEDADTLSPHISDLLRTIGVPHQHMHARMPTIYRKRKGFKPKGVSQRNRGIEWVRANATSGSVYFADDDNTYDVRLFEEMRDIKRVAMWPVGLCTKFGLSSPIVAENGTVIGFYDGWNGGRKFPVDMAGFAVSVSFLHKRPKAQMPYTPGFEEDGFLKSLAPFQIQDIEPKADGCTKIGLFPSTASSAYLVDKIGVRHRPNSFFLVEVNLTINEQADDGSRLRSNWSD